jgi:ABC-type transport system involved in multi-copper enzyme maturation permease subunit
MRAEIAKLRCLPTPRWIVITWFGLAALFAVGIVIDDPAQPSEYADAALAGSLVSTISTLVLGVWIVGIEYGQGTMRRMVAATPARLALIGSKFAVMLACVVLGTIAVIVLYWLVIAGSAAVVRGVSIPADELPDEIAGQLVFNVGLAVLGFSVALITRSMAGGITTTLVIALVVDSAIGVIPAVGDYTFGANLGDVSSAARGDDVELLGRAIAVSLAWLVALSAASWLVFDRRDVN